MILFAYPEFRRIAQGLLRLPDMAKGRFQVRQYKNQELYISLSTRVAGEDCVILGSLAPPAERLVTFGLLAHTLKKEGARKVVALLPYFAYAREDQEKPDESLGTAWAGELLKASGVDEIATVDLHSERDRELIPISIVSLSPAKLFAQAIKKHGIEDATIVAPDEGAISRCEAVRYAAGFLQKAAYFEKRRVGGRVFQKGPFGKIGKTVVLVDDIIDTGKTLALTVRALRKRGVRDIYAMVTHGLFSDRYWRNLISLKVKAIIVTNTIPRAKIAGNRVTAISIIPLLQNYFGGWKKSKKNR